MDEAAVATVLRITRSNSRLLHRLLSQTERVVNINHLLSASLAAVETTCESLVIGTR